MRSPTRPVNHQGVAGAGSSDPKLIAVVEQKVNHDYRVNLPHSNLQALSNMITHRQVLHRAIGEPDPPTPSLPIFATMQRQQPLYISSFAGPALPIFITDHHSHLSSLFSGTSNVARTTFRSRTRQRNGSYRVLVPPLRNRVMQQPRRSFA
jgi:hypothetical protein